MTEASPPIVVDPNQMPEQLGVAVRYALTLVGGYLVGKGWIDGDLLQVVLAAVTALAPAVYAAWRANRQKQALVALATAAPDHVGVVKGQTV